MAEERKLLTRREFLKTAGVVALGAAAAACAPAPAPTPVPPPATPVPGAAPTQPAIKGGPLEVGVLYEEGPWFDLTKEVGDQLEKDFPGTKIKYTFANTASDAARALRWESGDPLDVDTAKWNNQAPTTWSYVDNGMVLDLTPYLEEPLPSGEKWMDIYVPITRSFAVDQRPNSKTKGSWFGVPQELVLMLIHYNKKAFDEMGVEPAKTWPEFLDLCATIYEKGKDKGMKPICVSGPTDIYVGHWWDRMVQRMVGRQEVEKVVFGDGHLSDNPGFLAAAKEIEKIPKNDWLMDGYEGADFTAAQAMFFQGKAAMIHMGTWLVSEMADVIPEDFEVGTFDFPTVPEGKGNQKSMFGTCHLWSIPNPEISKTHEVNVPLAVEYLRRFCGREHLAKRTKVLGAISPCTKTEPPARLPGVDKLVEEAGKAELIIYYYGIHWDTALWAAWYPPVQALWLKKIDAETMIKQIDENLDKYRAMKAATPTPSS
ncbi:MAG TPA: extracellular solute-binding protein [Anaerolineae bacterium]|nr:extracellular solute-binding protein [Anaerolineae bacterium]